MIRGIFSSRPMAARLTTEQIERYSRQIMVPDLGGKAQMRLRDARVLVIGAGGLGSPAAFYLAAAASAPWELSIRTMSSCPICSARFSTRQKISASEKSNRPKRRLLNSIPMSTLKPILSLRRDQCRSNRRRVSFHRRRQR
jgi:shikimate 5-dehydrogenase